MNPKTLLASVALAAAGTVSLPSAADAQNVENMLVHRAKLRVETCDKKHAGTDDPVYVRLTNGNNRADQFYLDLPGDDRERNKVNNYDVILRDVVQVNDIQRMSIHKKGTDGWCVDSIALYLNNSSTPVFRKTYASGHWIDGNDGHQPSVYFSRSTLRASSTWNTAGSQAGMCAAPTRFSRGALENRIASLVGNSIATVSIELPLVDDIELYWGGKNGDRHVEIKQVDDKTLKADLDLNLRKPFFNRELDVDWEMWATCSDRSLKLSAGKPHVGISDAFLWFDFDYGSKKTGDFKIPLHMSYSNLGVSSITGAFATTLRNEGFQVDNANRELRMPCPRLTVDSDGDVNVSYSGFTGYAQLLRPLVMCLVPVDVL